jgi:glycogen(starch) synthase
MLGRSLAGNNYDLYSMLESINPEEEAYKLNIQSKFLTERACAQNCDAFTTVSEITALEAEKFFGRKADVLVLNGLDINKFPTIEETSVKHITVRERIREFLTYYFFPHYSFDLSHNLIFFIVGRYEFGNKGIDVFIRSLGKLNQRLKEEDSKRTVSAFFWIPAQNSGLRTEILENKNYYRHIKNFVNYHSEELINKVVSNIVSHKKLQVSNIFTKEFLDHLKKDIIHFRRSGDPPLSTHYMDEGKDAMMSELRKNGINNKEEDKVKAIIYPVYLDGADEMINLNYYDTMAGCHLGVFPSYYEPWGYTPLESAALGVAAITTDLAGFGRFIEKGQKKKEGIFVLKRMGLSQDEIVEKLADMLHDYAKLSHSERVHNKTVAKSLAALADWSILINNYIEAHNVALEKALK